MKSLLLLWKRLALECASRCNTSATLDCKTVERRSNHEGLSFLTITLPAFGKDFERSLELGRVGSDLFSGYSRTGGLPKLLSGFLCRVFDPTSGVLLDMPDIDAIRSIRQLTLMFGKMHLPCSPERVDKAFAQYVQCEQDVRESDSRLSADDIAAFKRVSSLLFSRFLTRVDREIYLNGVTPKHGPGSTADGLQGNRKYTGLTWTERLEKYFPCGEYLLPNHRYYDDLETFDILEPGAEIPAKVTTVPKTLKTPRIIAMEPTALQYVQQGILEVLMREMYREDDYLPIHQYIGTRSQVPNQDLARKGALTGTLATLDLSEASDRVSNQHVRHLLANYFFSEAVQACRSQKADVPGHGVIPLAKFASMGSALCFPFESMVFLTVVFIGIERSLNTSLTLRHVRELEGAVRIYGDDIIVPVEHVVDVISSLQNFGFVVNESKSFWNGQFRESCGKEYYSDEDVSIVRVRELLPTSHQDATEVASVVSLRNQLYWSGYWETVRWLDEYIRGKIRFFPMVESTSSVLGRESVLGYDNQRTHVHLQAPLVRGYVLSARPPINQLDGPGALLKFFLKRGDEPTFDVEHLERSGRPSVVYTKLRWAQPY